MALNRVDLGIQYFPQFAADRAIANAQIYIGQPNLDPQVVANQIQAYVVQENGTQVAVPQPIRTGAGGVPTYNGSPVQIGVAEAQYSFKVLTSTGSQIYYQPDNTDLAIVNAAQVTYNPAGTGAVATTVEDILDAQLMVDYAALRAYTGLAKTVRITGLLTTAQPQGIAGFFQYDETDVTSADNNATIIVDALGRRWKRVYKGKIQAVWFGALFNGVDDDWAEIQAALDFAADQAVSFSTGASVEMPEGEGVVSQSLVYKADAVGLVGAGKKATILRFTGTTGACLQSDGVLRNYCSASDFLIRTDVANTNGVDFTWFSYSDFDRLAFDLRQQNQCAIFAEGNGLGTGPYYNNFDKITINGRNNVVTTPGQVGVRLAPAPSGGLLADGPNSNIFTNFGRIAGVDRGFDIQSGNGNLGSNLSFESIASYAFAFNDRPADFTGTATSGTASSFTDAAAPFVPLSLGGGSFKIVGGTGNGESGTIRTATTTTITAEYFTRTGVLLDNTSQYEVYKTKASGNKFSNIRMEGSATTGVIARFYPGALNNVVRDVFAASISATNWIKDVAEGSNWCLLQNASQLVAIPYFVEGGLAAASTIPLRPNTVASIGGGYRFLPKGAHIVGMSVACDSLSGVAGSAVLSIWKSNVRYTDIDITLNANTLFGNSSYLTTYNTGTNARFEPQHDIDLRLVTDASWNGTARQISALLWVSV